MNANGILIVVLVTLSSILIGVSTKLITKRETDGQLESQSGYLSSVEKRPFCNAFTGCGKKRSSAYETMENRDLIDPIMRLSRKIMRDAKQWQLLQNRINNNNEMPQQNFPLLDYMSARKRRSIDSKDILRVSPKLSLSPMGMKCR